MTNSLPVLFLLSLLGTKVAALKFVEPRIDYFDGLDTANKCMSRLERRIEGKSGILVSHAHFDVAPYKGGRNCFIQIAVPIGYRVRIRAITFDVNGQSGTCAKDTLHVFDHETAIDPRQPHRPSDESVIPGPILGQFCGLIKNTSELVVSRQNVMTLWWHTDPKMAENGGGRGFKLIWNAFRKEMSAPCAVPLEFACGNAECIPAELACNSYADCADHSDLDARRQIDNECEQVYYDPLLRLSGVTVLLITIVCLLLMICLCFGVCFCCPCIDARLNSEQKFDDSSRKEYTPATEESAISGVRDTRLQPMPPTFFPPTPPGNANAFGANDPVRPIKPLHHPSLPIRPSEGGEVGCPIAAADHYYHKFERSLPRSVRIRSEYGHIDPPPSSVSSDYTYVRPVDSHII